MEGLSYLARSETRYALLESLADESKSRRALRDEVAASRSTVVRAVDRMATFGWVEETDGRYRLTALGAHVTSAFGDVSDAFATGNRLAPLLERVPNDEFDLDVEALADARVTPATPAEPLAPLDRVTELRAASSTVRELSSVVARSSVDQVAERAASGDVDHEIVLTADLVASLGDGSEYVDAFETALAAIDFYVYDGEFPFLLTLLDDCVTFGVVGDDDTPEALVETDDARAYEWAERTYREYRDAADPL